MLFKFAVQNLKVQTTSRKIPILNKLLTAGTRKTVLYVSPVSVKQPVLGERTQQLPNNKILYVSQHLMIYDEARKRK
jgi:hypothetical protein